MKLFITTVLVQDSEEASLRMRSETTPLQVLPPMLYDMHRRIGGSLLKAQVGNHTWPKSKNRSYIKLIVHTHGKYACPWYDVHTVHTGSAPVHHVSKRKDALLDYTLK